MSNTKQVEENFSQENKNPSQSAQIGRLRLRTLVTLRWLAIIGQAFAICIVAFIFGFRLPLTQAFSAIATSAWINIILTFAYPPQKLLKTWEAFIQILFDISQLTFLLYLTGGIQNPFIIMILAPVTIASATLTPRWIFVILLVSIACVTGLYFNYMPLPWFEFSHFYMPPLYNIGIYISIIIALLFSSAYSFRVASEELRLAAALIATQNILSREQRLAAVGGLAAAAAHELGTPLATIQLTAKEMTLDLEEGQAKDDATLILEQALRCRGILRDLSAHKNISDPTVEKLGIGQLLEEAASRHEKTNKAIVYYMQPPNEDENLIVRRMPEVLYGLGNLIENALGYANSKVTINCQWNNKNIEVNIIDDGKGFDPDILPRLGEPYVSSRHQGTVEAEKREGMGLGFFIAKTLLERSGAHLGFGNKTGTESGAIVKIIWSRSDLEFK